MISCSHWGMFPIDDNEKDFRDKWMQCFGKETVEQIEEMFVPYRESF